MRTYDVILTFQGLISMVLGFDSVKLLSQDKLSSYLRIYVLLNTKRQFRSHSIVESNSTILDWIRTKTNWFISVNYCLFTCPNSDSRISQVHNAKQVQLKVETKKIKISDSIISRSSKLCNTTNLRNCNRPWRGFIDGQLKSLGFSHTFIFLQFHVVWFGFNLPIRGEKFFKR